MCAVCLRFTLPRAAVMIMSMAANASIRKAWLPPPWSNFDCTSIPTMSSPSSVTSYTCDANFSDRSSRAPRWAPPAAHDDRHKQYEQTRTTRVRFICHSNSPQDARQFSGKRQPPERNPHSSNQICTQSLALCSRLLRALYFSMALDTCIHDFTPIPSTTILPII